MPRFYDMGSALQEANLSSYAGRVLDYNPAGGIGEMLLCPLGRQQGDRMLFPRLLHVVDDPHKPVLVYREANVAERPRVKGPRRFERNRSTVLRAVQMQHELVCTSRHLFLSVCNPPWRPFFCEAGQVVNAIPGREYYNASRWLPYP